MCKLRLETSKTDTINREALREELDWERRVAEMKYAKVLDQFSLMMQVGRLEAWCKKLFIVIVLWAIALTAVISIVVFVK